MKLYMEQKLFSWNDKFTIYSEDGEEYLTAKGEEVALNNNYCLYKDGTEVASIHEKIVSIRPKYTIKTADGKTELVKKAISARDTFLLENPEWKFVGDFLDHDYTVKGPAGEKLARITKKKFKMADCFEIDLARECDAVMVTTALLAIDAFLTKEKTSKK